MKKALTIAGSDSSGGAGIQADLKTFAALGAYGMSVVSAVTAQNTQGVRASHILEPWVVEQQLEAVLDDMRVDAIKIGMLGEKATIEVVADALARRGRRIAALDPVMLSKNGHSLLAPNAVLALVERLFPLADLVTPNVPEAEALTGLAIRDRASMEAAARALLGKGAKAVLVKGGHLSGDPVDLLVDEEGAAEFPGERIDGKHTHGTGCSLSSAIAAFRARGLGLRAAVRSAKDWVAKGIREGLSVGSGCGPIHHFHEYYDPEGKPRPRLAASDAGL